MLTNVAYSRGGSASRAPSSAPRRIAVPACSPVACRAPARGRPVTSRRWFRGTVSSLGESSDRCHEAVRRDRGNGRGGRTTRPPRNPSSDDSRGHQPHHPAAAALDSGRVLCRPSRRICSGTRRSRDRLFEFAQQARKTFGVLTARRAVAASQRSTAAPLTPRACPNSTCESRADSRTSRARPDSTARRPSDLRTASMALM